MKITANMVTVARILLLPLPCMLLLFGDINAWWIAFVLFGLLGATDFVDGMMARREGPTKLGGLIDPAADKIFIAAVMIPFTAVHFFPTWALVGVLSREFLMTSLRSSIALRRESVKTSNLAKLKTIYQMGGFGTIFMTFACSKTLLYISSFIIFAVLAALGFWYWLVRRQKVPFWIAPVSGAFLLVLILGMTVSVETSIIIQLMIIVALTWISAFKYIGGSYRLLARTGFHRYDVVRIFWTIAHGVLVVSTVAYFPQLALLVLVSISCELALGGVDNIVAGEHGYMGSLPFIVTSSMGIIYAVAALGLHQHWWQIDLIWFGYLLAAASILAIVFTFKKWGFLFRHVLD